MRKSAPRRSPYASGRRAVKCGGLGERRVGWAMSAKTAVSAGTVTPALNGTRRAETFVSGNPCRCCGACRAIWRVLSSSQNPFPLPVPRPEQVSAREGGRRGAPRSGRQGCAG